MNRNGLNCALENSNQVLTEGRWMIFLLFVSAERLSKFHTYLISCHPNMSFSFEQVKNGKFSFADFEVSQQQGKFVTTVYSKSSFSGEYNHFDSFSADGIQIWYDLQSSLPMF